MGLVASSRVLLSSKTPRPAGGGCGQTGKRNGLLRSCRQREAQVGSIAESASHQFTVYPERRATVSGIPQGPNASLDAALAEIFCHQR
jgi:hypothetical protein